MALRDRVYRRTDTGYKAWASDKSGLPGPYRRILGMVENETSRQIICERMASYEERQVVQWIDELETLGFVESNSVDLRRNFEYTPSAFAGLGARSRVA